MSYGEADSHPSGFEQGNTGYSGAPMWKIKQQTAQYQAMVEAAQRDKLDEERRKEEAKKQVGVDIGGTKILVDHAALRASEGQQLVRHIIVKDLRKVASGFKMDLPISGIFDDKGGQRALFALFDGQNSAAPGPLAADMCVKKVLGKLLTNFSSLPASNCTKVFVQAALLKTFEDLDREMQSEGVTDRCGASLALIIGDWLFTAVLGSCGLFLCRAAPEADRSINAPNGGYVAVSVGTQAQSGASNTADSLGTPDVRGTELKGGEALDPFFIITGSGVTKALTMTEMFDISSTYLRRPRACTGEITARAGLRMSANDAADLTAIAAYYRKPDVIKAGQPAAKKAKLANQQMDSVRLRHIFLMYKEDKDARMLQVNPNNNKPITRSREEAEEMLRQILTELLKDGDHTGDSNWASKVTQRIITATRAHSECKSALKGGSSCGDIGWKTKQELQQMGQKDFADKLFALGIAEWSDLLFSEQGAHLFMRMA